MNYVVPYAYRERLARAIAGEGVILRPAYVTLGNGRYNPSSGEVTIPNPTDTSVVSPLPGYTNLPVALTRVGRSVRISINVPGGGAMVLVSELGIFTEDGVPVVLDAFRPFPLEAPLTFVATYTIYPDV